MSEQLDQLERQYQPTALKLQRARKTGNVAKSAELTATLVTIAAAAAVCAAGPAAVAGLTKMTASMISSAQVAAVSASPGSIISVGVMALGPVALAAIVVAVLASVAQVGLLLAGKQVSFDWDRVSPASGIRRLMSVRTLAKLTLLLVKIVAIGSVCYVTIRPGAAEISGLASLDAQTLANRGTELLWQLTWRCGLAMIALGLLDYLYQRWQYRRDLRMSYRELRDDLKQMEGKARKNHSPYARATHGRKANATAADAHAALTEIGNV